MKIATGKVIGGKIVVEGTALDEGSIVTVLAGDEGESFEVSAEEESALLEAIDETRRGHVISAEQLLKDLRRPA